MTIVPFLTLWGLKFIFSSASPSVHTIAPKSARRGMLISTLLSSSLKSITLSSKRLYSLTKLVITLID